MICQPQGRLGQYQGIRWSRLVGGGEGWGGTWVSACFVTHATSYSGDPLNDISLCNRSRFNTLGDFRLWEGCTPDTAEQNVAHSDTTISPSIGTEEAQRAGDAKPEEPTGSSFLKSQRIQAREFN